MSNPKTEGRLREPQYGRRLDDFTVGEIYHHPWEVTIDDGMLAMFAASFLDPNPLYSSRRFARDLGFRDRVIHPLLLMNLALSFTVHDISEQAIAHLAYIDLKFPNAAYPGDTISVSTEVLGVRASESKPDRGVIHVRTRLPVCITNRRRTCRARWCSLCKRWSSRCRKKSLCISVRRIGWAARLDSLKTSMKAM